jgi:hypothetical protein
MPAPQLFFNDASLGTPLTGVEHLKVNLRRFVEAAVDVLSVRAESLFGFEAATFRRTFFDQDLYSLLASAATSKDEYRHVLVNLRSLDAVQVEHAMDTRDVYIGGQTNIGAILADLCMSEYSMGWIVSAQSLHEPYDTVSVAAERYSLGADGEMLGPVAIQLSNIACRQHVTHWRNHLYDFGNDIAASAKIDEIDGRPIVMYSGPLEHFPPHVHILVGRASSATFAKYRFDVFAREMGPPKYDSQMSVWVAKYRDQLMRSWDHCQRGHRPFELQKVPG